MMNVIVIQGVEMIPASEVYAALQSLRDSRDLYLKTAVGHNAELTSIHAALEGLPDSGLADRAVLAQLAAGIISEGFAARALSADRLRTRELLYKFAEAHCSWRQADCDGPWRSDCGACFAILDGTPAENCMNYCHKCGRLLVVAEVPAEEQDDE